MGGFRKVYALEEMPLGKGGVNYKAFVNSPKKQATTDFSPMRYVLLCLEEETRKILVNGLRQSKVDKESFRVDGITKDTMFALFKQN